MILGTQDNPQPSNPGRTNFSPVSLKSPTNRLHEDHQLGDLTLAGRVILAGGTTFSHIITLSRRLFACHVSHNV